WTSESNKSQSEHNYFSTKPWLFDWIRNNFERKWGNTTGHLETTPFVPLPPDVPIYVAPARGASNVSTSSPTISWKPGPWAHAADVRFGTSPAPPVLAANISISPLSTKTYTLPALSPGTTYYWQIVSKTVAKQEAAGEGYSFPPAGGDPPPPPPPPPPGGLDVVLHTADATRVAGGWVLEGDTSAG